jgi:hypothetical protein
MRTKTLVIAALAFGFLGVASLGIAQGPPEKFGQGTMPKQSKGFSLADELDELGKNLFGDISPDDERPRKPQATQPNKRTGSTASNATGTPTRTTKTTPNTSLGGTAYSNPGVSEPEVGNYGPPSGRTTVPVARPVRRPTVETATLGSRPTGKTAAVRTGTLRAEAATDDDDDDTDAAPTTTIRRTPPSAASGGSTARPLHERLSGFQQSTFTPSNRKPQPAPVEEGGVSRSGSMVPDVVVASDPPAAPPRQPTPAVAATNVPTPAASGAIRMPESGVSGRPVVAPRGLAPYRTESRPAVDTAVAPRVAVRPNVAAKPQENLLITRKGPALSVETTGPRKITVGRESVYGVTLINSGEVAAEEVVVFVNLPAWADVAGAEASTGVTQAATTGEAAKPFLWKVGSLAANGKERLVLRIVPRESKPFDLAIRWDYKPVASQAMIEVQEPKVAMRLEGPREVHYGRREVFTLKLANTGTGDAENMVVALTATGTGDNQPVSQKIGVLTAGEEKSIEVELTARQSGDLQIQVEARGDGNVHAQLAEKIMVRRASLQIDVDGPQMQYVGAVSSYKFRLQNPGSAPARNIKLTVAIPPGAKYLSGIDNAALAANGTRLQWAIDTLNPGVEQVFVVKCSLGLPGANKVEVAIAAEDELSATAATTTRVEALADLVLEVKDPARPVPVGEDVVYELHVRNRGTKSAENVEVVAFFSRGVEPVSVEGGQGRLAPGQVVFQPIPSLAPGADAVMKVHAKADAAGNHVFRTEVYCKPLGTRLANEQTTHFYQDGSAPQQASRPAPEVQR